MSNQAFVAFGTNSTSPPSSVGSCQDYSILVASNDNAFNPCFLAAFLVASSLTFSILGLHQLAIIKRKAFHGKLFNIKSEGFNQFLRLILVTLQGIFYLLLSYELFISDNVQKFTSLASLGFLTNAILVLFILLPLHALEVHKSIWQLATPLLYWVSLPILFTPFTYQNLYTDYPLLTSKSFNILLVGSHVIAIAMCFLEFVFWNRAHEYTYDLKLNEVDVESIYNANVFGKITFSNLNKMITKGYKEQNLTFEDLPAVSDELKSSYAAEKVRKYWEQELLKPKAKASLLKPLFKAFGPKLLVSFAFQIIDICLSFVQPQLLKKLMYFFLHVNKDQPQILEGILICFAMAATTLFQVIFWNKYINEMFNVSYLVRLSLSSLIYEKSLRLSTAARSKRSVGDILNLVGVDISKVEFLITQSNTVISSPLQFTLCLVSLYFMLGWTAFTGLIIVAFAIPLNLWAVGKLETLFDKNMRYKDLRTKAISEILNSMRSIKFYSWEKPMSERIADIRDNKELAAMKKIGVFDALTSFSWNCVPYFVSCITFAFFVFFKSSNLTSDLIFPALSLFELLGDPLFLIPDLLSTFVDVRVSINRLLKFLLDEELDDALVKELEVVSKSGASAVEIRNATFLRSNNQTKKEEEEAAATTTTPTDEENAIESTGPVIALENINFSAKKRELTCIVGSVGSGKTTFLQSILGHYSKIDAAPEQGESFVKVRGNIAYCPQHPWIMNASIKKNITFGHKFDQEFFDKTVDACELKADFEMLADGDETQVGEKGISLSGGQKARISLARAVYARADIYLLDDVLSAVDAHVSKNIIDKVLSKNGVLASKTLILSTNHIHVLEEADSIYVLDHGKISEVGTYETLLSDKGEFSKLIEEFGKAVNDGGSTKANSTIEKSETEEPSEPVVEKSEEKDDGDAVTDEVTDFIEDIDSEEAELQLKRTDSKMTLRRASVASFNHPIGGNEQSEDKKTGQTKETSQKGNVKWDTFKRYFKAAKYRNIALTAFVVISGGLADFGSKYWLKHWADLNDNGSDSVDTIFMISVYTVFGVCCGVTVLLGALVTWCFSAISASKNIHMDLIVSIMKSPMSFFETTPTGRILNRFSSDMDKLDTRFPHCFNLLSKTIMQTLLTFGFIFIALPKSVIFIVLISFVYRYIQVYYASASRETKRLFSVTRSPVYSHVHETMSGVETIKAFNQEERFRLIHYANLDYSMVAGIANLWMTRWIGFRLKGISAAILLMVTLSTVFSLKTNKPLSAGIVGMLTTLTLQLTSHLIWLVRTTVDLETTAVSVERILEYCDLKSEAPYIIEKSRPPIQWPMKGGIKFVNYTTKYKPDADPVLKNISFEVKPQEKVGIVGRTGAGKSTLTLSLFRIIEGTEGSIIIDDIDTSKIGLFDLRSKLNIIPQDSQAFEGTVRINLDPFHKFRDDELWDALDMAHLKEHVKSMKDEAKDENKDSVVITEEVEAPPGEEGKGLYAKVSQGGANLSAGQRQLLCLARALLNPSKILLLDEATAAVDVKTDKIVQETIRDKFKDRTILTIAHRIDTIMDNDKILVLDKGEVKEFDSPENLLKDKNTIFYSLCEKGGYLKNDQ